MTAIGRQRDPRHVKPSGLTLIEILLVLVVLVITAAFAWPLLTRAFEAQRLRAAADLVRSRLTLARIEAIETGEVCRFQYAIEGRRFTVSGTSEVNLAADSEIQAALGVVRSSRRLSGELPEGIVFAAPDMESPGERSTSAAPQTGSEDSETGETSDGAESWSPPIYFHPDGTTTSAVIRVKNAYGRILDVTLRGETGVITVSEIYVEQGL